jgi:hypothetical protein
VAGRGRRVSVALAVALATTGLAGVAGAGSDPTFACARVDADDCTVTIPLTSNMDERVGSTMPDAQPWYLSEAGGHGPYGITGPGNPQTTWDGVGGATQGTVWSAVLTTGANEPSGSEAVLTFSHVTPATSTTVAAQPYASLSESYPLRVPDGATATVTATVRPVPPKGHLLLQRRSGSAWVTVGAFTYSTSAKRWTIRFAWHFPRHATETFRLLATATAGLTATDGGPFKIATAA